MPIEKVYAPKFDVRLGNAPAPEPLRKVMASVSFTTGLDGADRVEVTIANQALRWLDDDALTIGTEFQLGLGYDPGEAVPVFAGEITGVAASFPSSGVPQLTVTAQDRRHRMQQGVQAKWHAITGPSVNLPRLDAQVADAVAARHGLRVETDPLGAKLLAVLTAAAAVAVAADPDSGQKAIQRQTNESDHDFLRRIARENGMELLIDHTDPAGGKVLRLFSPLDHLEPDLELEYGLSLIEFTPRETSVGQVEAVRANVWLPAIQTRVGVSLGVGGDPPGLTLAVTPGAPAKADDPNTVVLLNEPLSPATAPRRLLGELLPRLNEQRTGSGSTVGNPLIRAGTVLRLAGLGVRFGGLYRVKSATHTIDSGGYRTRFEVRKEIWLDMTPKDVQKAVRVRRPAAIKVHA
jgi:phage protein D